MSYDISLVAPVTKQTMKAYFKHQIRGGTYQVGGTSRLHLNVTYNYAPHFTRAFESKEGVRMIYGMTGAESIPVLRAAIARLGDDVDEDYWKSTEGNAKQALYGLLAFAHMRPDGVWKGD